MLRARHAYKKLAESATEGRYDELYREIRRMIPQDSCASLCARMALFDYGLIELDTETRRRIDRAYREFVPPAVIRRMKVPNERWF
jgi:hypothetical protein